MSRVIVSMSVSMDGYFEGPHREIDWHLVDEEVHTFFNDGLRGAGAFLGGRITYEMMEGFWPTADEDPAAPEPIREFARIWRDTPKIVYSRSLKEAGENATIVRDVVPAEVETLKAGATGPLFVGGAQLASTFLAHDLIDECWLSVHPVVIGAGRPLFETDPVRRQFRLLETRPFGNGVVHLRYERVR